MRVALRLLGVVSISMCLTSLAFASTCAGSDSTLNVSEQTATGATNGTTFGDVCVTLTDTTTASITFTSASNYAFIDSSMTDVQVNASSFTLGSTITESPHAGQASDGGSGNVNGYGVFNQTINNMGGAENAETTVTFTLTNSSGTWASAADVLTANASNFDAAAHVICLTGSGCEAAGDMGTPLTFFVAENAPVPEPRFYALLLAGFIAAIGAIVRRRNRIES